MDEPPLLHFASLAVPLMLWQAREPDLNRLTPLAPGVTINLEQFQPKRGRLQGYAGSVSGTIFPHGGPAI
jgi:hypothetical protein